MAAAVCVNVGVTDGIICCFCFCFLCVCLSLCVVWCGVCVCGVVCVCVCVCLCVCAHSQDEEVLADLYDFLIAGAAYGAIMENQAAELGMRMSSMENASKNCGEVLAGLRLLYNRQRQAAITTELTEIVAGAESVSEK